MRSILQISWRTCCVAIILLGIAAKADAQRDRIPEEGEKPPVPTSEATAILRIVCPAESGLTNPALIEDLVQTGYGVTSSLEKFEKKFSKEALKAAEAKDGLFDITLEKERFNDLPAGVYMADITVYSYDQRLSADKLLKEVQSGLRSDLRTLDRDPDEDGRRFERERELADLKNRAEVLAKEIEQLEKLRGLDTSDNVVEQRLLRVDNEMMAARMRASGLNATRESLRKRIAELAPKVAKASQGDPVVHELDKVVRLREEAKAKLAKLAAGGQVTQGSIRDAEENLAQARAEYAKQVRLATQDAGGLRLADLQQRLEDNESEVEESAAKLKQLEELFSELNSRDRSRAELDHKKAMLETYRKAANKLASELVESRMQHFNYIGPTVRLISVKTTENEKE